MNNKWVQCINSNFLNTILYTYFNIYEKDKLVKNVSDKEANT